MSKRGKRSIKEVEEIPASPIHEKILKYGSGNSPDKQLNWDKEELKSVVYWMRQVIGVLVGIVIGVIGIKGVLGFLTYGLVNLLIPFFYYTKFLQIDIEAGEHGEHTDLAKEGFGTSFGLFLLVWIASYSTMIPS